MPDKSNYMARRYIYIEVYNVLLIFIYLLLKIYFCVWAIKSVCMYCLFSWSPRRSEEVVGFCGTGVMDGCEPPIVLRTKVGPSVGTMGAFDSSHPSSCHIHFLKKMQEEIAIEILAGVVAQWTSTCTILARPWVPLPELGDKNKPSLLAYVCVPRYVTTVGGSL